MLEFSPSHLCFPLTPASCFSSKYLFFFVPLLVFLLLPRLCSIKQTNRKTNKRRKLKKRKTKQPSRKISWSVFPSDVEDNILSRLPANSLMRYRCVCKHWCNLVTKPHFIKMQLNRSTQIKQGSKLVYVSYGKAYSLDVRTCGEQYMETSARPNDHREKLWEASVREVFLPSKGRDYNSLRVLGSCNGILFLSALGSLYLLNPCTEEFKKLPYPRTEKQIYSSPAYGFGYCPRTDEYKLIVTMMIEQSTQQSTHPDVYVYTFGTDSSWRSIGGSELGCYRLVDSAPHVLVNGALHWMASGTPGLSIATISFDLGDEEFKEFSVPESFSKQHSYDPKGLVELGGFLCLYHCKAHENFDIWVMMDYGDEQSWTKKFSVPCRVFSGFRGPIKPLCILRNEEVVLFENGDGFFIVDLVTKQELFHLGVMHAPHKKMYLESLVSLRTDGVDGTKQERREKERGKISRGGKKHLACEVEQKPQV